MNTKLVVKMGNINEMLKEIEEHMTMINRLVWRMSRMGVDIVIDIDEEKADTGECQPKE